jgi:hypothetical protein
VHEVATRLLAVQAQDPRGARLAVRSRSTDLAASDVDRALSRERSVAVGWLNRGTLHLVAAEDYWWLHALTAPTQLTGNAHRLQQEGVSPEAAERGVRALVDALGSEGPLPRAVLREKVAAADVPVAGQALVHVLLLASLRGLVVRGPVSGNGSGAAAWEQTFVLAEEWLGPAPQVDRDAALAELAVRYLVGHGPADERDLARWAGLPLGAVRRGLRAVADRLVDLGDGLVDLASRHDEGAIPPPRLLGAFDPLLLGWRSREAVVGPHRTLVTSNGLFRPFALVGGRAVATWGIAGGTVRIQHLEDVAEADRAALERDAAAVESFLAS